MTITMEKFSWKMLLCFYGIPTKTLMMLLRFIILCRVTGQASSSVSFQVNILLEQFDSSGDRNLSFQEFTVWNKTRQYTTAVICKYLLQKILAELQDSGWNIHSQEENDHLAASDLKEMFIEADKERRNSSGLVVPKRVKLLIILEIF